jgi:hypothetical protein
MNRILPCCQRYPSCAQTSTPVNDPAQFLFLSVQHPVELTPVQPEAFQRQRDSLSVDKRSSRKKTSSTIKNLVCYKEIVRFESTLNIYRDLPSLVTSTAQEWKRSERADEKHPLLQLVYVPSRAEGQLHQRPD